MWPAAMWQALSITQTQVWGRVTLMERSKVKRALYLQYSSSLAHSVKVPLQNLYCFPFYQNWYIIWLDICRSQRNRLVCVMCECECVCEMWMSEYVCILIVGVCLCVGVCMLWVGSYSCVLCVLVYSLTLQICVWSEDVNRFVEDDENEFSYSGYILSYWCSISINFFTLIFWSHSVYWYNCLSV